MRLKGLQRREEPKKMGDCLALSRKNLNFAGGIEKNITKITERQKGGETNNGDKQQIYPFRLGGEAHVA